MLFMDDLPFPVAVQARASTRLLFALILSIRARFPNVCFEPRICATVFLLFILQLAAFGQFAVSSLGLCSCESLDFSLYAEIHSVRLSPLFDAIWILLDLGVLLPSYLSRFPFDFFANCLCHGSAVVTLTAFMSDSQSKLSCE